MNRDEILAAKEPVFAVDVPEWGEGEVVHVRTLSVQEVMRVSEKEFTEAPNFIGRFAVIVIGDENGERLFADESAEAIAGKGHGTVLRICEEAQAFNGMMAGAQEEAKKN